MTATIRPTTLPRWADGVSADVTEPTSGKKDLGWEDLEKPPHDYMNWIQYTEYLWSQYFAGDVRGKMQASMHFVEGAAATFAAFNDTAWNPDGAVVLGTDGGKIWYTSDAGLRLTDVTPGTPGHIKSIEYDEVNDRFVAVDFAGALYSSSTGASWSATGGSVTGVAIPTGLRFNQSVASPVWVCCDTNGKVFSSTNLSTWTDRGDLGDAHTALEYSADLTLFTVVGGHISGAGKVYTSPDGATWTLRASTTSQLKAVTAGRGLIVVAGFNGQLFTSDNGTTWVDRSPFVSTTDDIYDLRWSGEMFAMGWLVSGGESQTSVWYSADGLAWERALHPLVKDLPSLRLAWSPLGRWIACEYTLSSLLLGGQSPSDST